MLIPREKDDIPQQSGQYSTIMPLCLGSDRGKSIEFSNDMF